MHLLNNAGKRVGPLLHIVGARFRASIIHMQNVRAHAAHSAGCTVKRTHEPVRLDDGTRLASSLLGNMRAYWIFVVLQMSERQAFPAVLCNQMRAITCWDAAACRRNWTGLASIHARAGSIR